MWQVFRKRQNFLSALAFSLYNRLVMDPCYARYSSIGLSYKAICMCNFFYLILTLQKGSNVLTQKKKMQKGKQIHTNCMFN